MVMVPAICWSQPSARAASVQGVNPQVEAAVWQEDGCEMAAVTLNGKELLTFRSEAGSGAAARAEDLAGKLQDLLDDKKFDANSILPARAGGLAAIQMDGSTVVSFDPVCDAKASRSSSLETSWKLVNAIRTAYSTPTLPGWYLKLMDQAEQKLASDSTPANCFSGQASWYGGRFHGRKTSDGHRYDQEKMTAAHRSLPFGTKLLVMNRKTGNSCVVEINDRGPFVGDRVIDLSRAAARQLNMLTSGVALVDCLILGGN